MTLPREDDPVNSGSREHEPSENLTESAKEPLSAELPVQSNVVANDQNQPEQSVATDARPESHVTKPRGLSFSSPGTLRLFRVLVWFAAAAIPLFLSIFFLVYRDRAVAAASTRGWLLPILFLSIVIPWGILYFWKAKIQTPDQGNQGSAKKRARVVLIWLALVAIPLSLYGLFLVYPDKAFEAVAAHAWLLPLLLISLVLIPWSFLYFWKARTGHQIVVHVLIYFVTIASLFAFGYPKSINPEDLRHSFAEMCVVLTLFLLAELAAVLMLQAEGFGNALTKTSNTIQEKLSGTATSVGEAFEKQTRDTLTELTALRSQIHDVAQQIKLEKLGDLVQNFDQIYGFLDSVKEITDPQARDQILGGVRNYTQAWSNFLKFSDAPTHSDRCALTLFQAYIEEEMKDLRAFSSEGNHRRIVLATNDDLYLEVLRRLLMCMVECEPEAAFAWAITNVLPRHWYFWGEEYRLLGSYEFMDRFREEVRRMIKEDQKEYKRLFMISSSIDEPRDWTFDHGRSRIRLQPSKKLLEMNDQVILLQSNNDSEPSDRPLHASMWRKLLKEPNADYWDGTDPGETYCIITENQLNSLEGSWSLNNTNTIEHKETGDILRETYRIRPVKLLEYFQAEFQSSPMGFLAINNEDQLDGLPVKNADWFVLGAKSGTDYNPAIAISANLVLGSKTMLMQVFTSDEDLKKIKVFLESNPGLCLTDALQNIREEINASQPDKSRGVKTP